MMKQRLLTLALICLLWNQNSSAELKVRFANDLVADRTSLKLSLETTANDFWFGEEQYWKMVPVDHELEIDFSLISAQHLAQTRQNRINFNVYTAEKDIGVTLKHEIAHVFLNRHCPNLTDAFTQELFSYWRSGDYLRLLYGQKQMYSKADALRELKQVSAFGKSKAIAIARLINELVKKDQDVELKKWFSGVLKKCQDSTFLKTQSNLAGEFIDRLQGQAQNQTDTNEFGFLVFDSLANEIITSEGQWKTKQSVGSALKPFLISFFHDVKETKIPKKTLEWECGQKFISKWNYSKALNFSCNGFFLDTKIKFKEVESYTKMLNDLTQSSYQPDRLNMADMIGLWPTIKLDLLDLARIYDFILETDKTTISILKQTPVAGTLSGHKESNWFIQKGVALKSGTTTQLNLSVEKGFLVAVFDVESAPKIALLYRAGYRPVDLLPELKSKIEKYIGYPDRPAQVQVLSSFPVHSIQLTCPSVVLQNRKPWRGDKIFDVHKLFSLKSRLSCAGAPFEVKSNDQIVRKLYGDITFQKSENIAPLNDARSEKNARARKGSELVLNTSEWHYLRSVSFSESGNYRQELKKAMLLVFKNNLAFWKTKKKPICDTTLCQVFNLNYEQVTAAQKKTIDDLILELGSSNLGSSRWLEFSLGGAEAWTQNISISVVSAFLNTEKLSEVAGVRKEDIFEITYNTDHTTSFPCEKLRTYFKLKSCPDTAAIDESGEVEFKGQGEGHDRGMDLVAANQLAIQGFNFDQIIESFYKLKIQK